MSLVVLDEKTGRMMSAKMQRTLDELEKKKKKNDIWGVFETALEIWKLKEPEKYDSLLVETKDERLNQASETGSSKQKIGRRMVDIPFDVVAIMRMMYNEQELPMDKAFFREVWKRYPKLRIAEKL